MRKRMTSPPKLNLRVPERRLGLIRITSASGRYRICCLFLDLSSTACLARHKTAQSTPQISKITMLKYMQFSLYLPAVSREQFCWAWARLKSVDVRQAQVQGGQRTIPSLQTNYSVGWGQMGSSSLTISQILSLASKRYFSVTQSISVTRGSDSEQCSISTLTKSQFQNLLGEMLSFPYRMQNEYSEMRRSATGQSSSRSNEKPMLPRGQVYWFEIFEMLVIGHSSSFRDVNSYGQPEAHIWVSLSISVSDPLKKSSSLILLMQIRLPGCQNAKGRAYWGRTFVHPASISLKEHWPGST